MNGGLNVNFLNNILAHLDYGVNWFKALNNSNLAEHSPINGLGS